MMADERNPNYKQLTEKLWIDHLNEIKIFSTNPMKCPSYNDELSAFVKQRSKVIISLGADPSAYNYNIEFDALWAEKFSEKMCYRWKVKDRLGRKHWNERSESATVEDVLKIILKAVDYEIHSKFRSSNYSRSSSPMVERTRGHARKFKVTSSDRRSISEDRKISESPHSEKRFCNEHSLYRHNSKSRSTSKSYSRSTSKSYSRSRSRSRSKSYSRYSRTHSPVSPKCYKSKSKTETYSKSWQSSTPFGHSSKPRKTLSISKSLENASRVAKSKSETKSFSIAKYKSKSVFKTTYESKSVTKYKSSLVSKSHSKSVSKSKREKKFVLKSKSKSDDQRDNFSKSKLTDKLIFKSKLERSGQRDIVSKSKHKNKSVVKSESESDCQRNIASESKQKNISVVKSETESYLRDNALKSKANDKSVYKSESNINDQFDIFSKSKHKDKWESDFQKGVDSKSKLKDKSILRSDWECDDHRDMVSNSKPNEKSVFKLKLDSNDKKDLGSESICTLTNKRSEKEFQSSRENKFFISLDEIVAVVTSPKLVQENVSEKEIKKRKSSAEERRKTCDAKGLIVSKEAQVKQENCSTNACLSMSKASKETSELKNDYGKFRDVKIKSSLLPQLYHILNQLKSMKCILEKLYPYVDSLFYLVAETMSKDEEYFTLTAVHIMAMELIREKLENNLNTSFLETKNSITKIIAQINEFFKWNQSIFT